MPLAPLPRTGLILIAAALAVAATPGEPSAAAGVRPAGELVRSAASDVAAVDAVSFVTEEGRLVVRIHATERVRSFSVDQRGRTVEVILYGARLASSFSRGAAASPVRDYRVEAGTDRVTLTFDAPGDAPARVLPDPASNDLLLTFGEAPARRVVAWGGLAAPQAPRAETPRGETPRAETPRVETARVDAPTVRRTTPTRRRYTPSASSGSAPTASAPIASRPAVTVPMPSAPASGADAPEVIVPYTREASAAISGANWRLDTIVLDAGHGGHDVGATYHGVREKDVTLGIVRRLGRMLEQDLGVRVVYTRTDDHFEELRDRGRIANRAGGKLFISVHANSAGSGRASGTETYFLAPHRTASAQEVMDRENSVIDMESAPELYAEFHDQGNILQAMAMSAYQEESQELARLVESQFVGQSRTSRGVKQAGFLVLWAASMPAILVETGFVSNSDEARLLNSSDGQEDVARAIYNAVAAYKQRYERGLRLASSN